MNGLDDEAVEAALHKRACGYDIDETVEEESERTGRKTRKTTYHIPGDVRAQIFWLRNRRPERWKDHPQSPGELEGGISIVDDVPESGDFAGVLCAAQEDP